MKMIKPEKKHLMSDLLAGLTFALVNIPQSMGHALLAAVNPVFALYTLMPATPIGEAGNATLRAAKDWLAENSSENDKSVEWPNGEYVGTA